jgi:hypothetical protein
MVKVLIYSSKEIYDAASYEGRAEAAIVAYRKDDDYLYEVVKNRTKYYMGNYVTYKNLALDIRLIEQSEGEEEFNDYRFAQENAKLNL